MKTCKLKLVLFSLCLALNCVTTVFSECQDHFFDCKNGRCIASFFQCDDDNDCGNYEDELHCMSDSISSSNLTIHHVPHACPKDHFPCGDLFGTCLPSSWVCDGMKECMNGADEANCTVASKDCGSDFKCGSLECLPPEWTCDGLLDCEDGSDERNCTDYKQMDALCDKEHGKFQCSNGLCIPYSKVCDKVPDCALHDDEGLICQVNECHEKKCSHLCMVDPATNATTCYCPPGYHLMNNSTCVDFDECQSNQMTNLCTQRCVNLEGSFKCECFDNYQMINSTCQVKGQSPVLYYSTGFQIRAFDLRNHSLYPVVVANQRHEEMIIGMDMVVAKQKMIYFSSQEHSHGTVYDVSIAGYDKYEPKSEVRLLFHEDLKGIEGLAVDWLANHYYITESTANKILVCNIDSPLCGTVLANLSSPRGILAMPAKGKIFWSQWQGQVGIYQAGMDGQQVSILIEAANLRWPNSLALDEVMNRLYWCDGHKGSIEYYDFETTSRHVVFSDHNRQPYSVAVFEDNLYWSDWATNQIEVCNKITGHHMKPLIMDAKDRFFGLFVYHPEVQAAARKRPLFNPCDLSPCSHLCLLQLGATHYSCHCPDDMKLSPLNNQTCLNKVVPPPSAIAAIAAGIRKGALKNGTTKNVVVATTTPKNQSTSAIKIETKLPVKVIVISSDTSSATAAQAVKTPEKTDKAAAAISSNFEDHRQVQSSTSSHVASFFWKLVLFSFIASLAIFVYFWVQSPTFRMRVNQSVGSVRNRSRTVRFVKNPRYEPEYIVDDRSLVQTESSQVTVDHNDREDDERNINPFK